MADISALVRKATIKLGDSPVDRKLRFLRITEEVVRGLGLNPSETKRITREVREAMSAASGRSSHAKAVAKRVSQRIRDRISP